ncbi:MAG: hypothetical protein HY897_08455 [Deltaproteobacteria bacterium]|nr:hypothetical protein [Deltaproteobacteria bacterium]
MRRLIIVAIMFAAVSVWMLNIQPAHAGQKTWQCTCKLVDDETKKDKGEWGPKTMCAKTEEGAQGDANKQCEKETKDRKVNCKCHCKKTGKACDW